jgi:uroporphyrinogen decarboxylase
VNGGDADQRSTPGRMMPTDADAKPLIAALRKKTQKASPIWLMRQAGRYLPEYREIRSKAKSFLDFCYDPANAAEVTLQLVRRFGFDAAILFSDILVIPDAMGQKVAFEANAGPRLEALETPEAIARIADGFSIEKLAPVFETVARVKSALPSETAFIGFCGAPWTVASYMIAGKGTTDQAPARLFAYRHPEAFALLIDRLVDASTQYLLRQIDAGVEVVQIFDSWAGVLPPAEFKRWVAAPVRAITQGVKAQRPDAYVIAFIRGAGSQLSDAARKTGADAYGLDTNVDPRWAIRNCPEDTVFQGNLDPLSLAAGGATLDRDIDAILEAFSGRPHIFNLGHGIIPETPIAHVERLVSRVRGA